MSTTPRPKHSSHKRPRIPNDQLFLFEGDPHAEIPPARLETITTDEMMAAFRSAVRNAGPVSEPELLNDVASRFGYQDYQELDEELKATLRKECGRAADRTIIQQEGGTYRPATPTFADYDDDVLLSSLPTILKSGVHYRPDDIARLLAAHFGYAGVTKAMRERMTWLIAKGVKREVLGSDGGTLFVNG